METFVWLENPETGGCWRCPVGAAEVWRARGWQNCEPPVDTEPHLHDQIQPEPAVERAEPKTASRKRGGETTTAPEEG